MFRLAVPECGWFAHVRERRWFDPYRGCCVHFPKNSADTIVKLWEIVPLETPDRTDSRHWFVKQIIADDSWHVGDGRRDRPNHIAEGGVELVIIEPEVVKRPRDRRGGIIHRPRTGLMEGNVVVVDRPRGSAIATEVTAIQVLMYIDEHVDIVIDKQLCEVSKPDEIVAIDALPFWCDPRPEDTKPDNVEPPRADALDVRRCDFLR